MTLNSGFSPLASRASSRYLILDSDFLLATLAVILRKCRRLLQIHERATTRLLILILAGLVRDPRRGDNSGACRVITGDSEFWTYKL